MYLSIISMQLVLAFVSTTNAQKHPTRQTSQRGHQSINQHRGEDRQAQSPSFATHNFEPLYRADSQQPEGGTNKRRPNIVLILTDDQDIDLGSLQFMPKLARHMSSQGTTFSHGFVSTPMCCPSRSTLLTGLYVHNHDVYTNNDNCSSPYWVQEHEPRTFATYLQDSGYSTAYFGKYLNKYQGTRVPAGWGEWQGLIRNSRFYNYTLNVNGKLHHHGFNYEKDYLPDIITNRSMNFLRWSLTSSPETPVLAVLSYPGPHGPEDSAPQYQHLFHNVTTHHTPAYNLAPNPDKQWILRETGKMAPIQQRFTDMLQTKRLQTLQSVDDGVEKVVNLLKDLGELDNTYLFYTSDHGYHLGQYGLVKGKAFPFDVDTHVPLIVRGPGVPANVHLDQPVVNIDLAPTFLDAGGLKPPPHMDGRSMLDVFRLENSEEASEDVAPWRSAFLIERGKMTLERYMKVSAVFNSSLEGSNPLFSTSRLTKRERVEIECKKPRYQLPCQPDQKWYCKERKDGVMKMRKCAVENDNGEKCRCNETVKTVPNWKYTKLAPKERKDQKSFLRRHVTKVGKIRSRFLKMKRNGEIGGFLSSIAGDSAARRRRWRRESAISNAGDETSFEGLLHDVAEQEIQEVDTIVQDITDQLRDLHVFNVVNNTNSDATSLDKTKKGNLLGEDCYINMNNVVCTPKTSRAELSWEESRQAVRQQIQRLRAQLHELKQIRRYLHVRRPKKHPRKSRVQVLKSMSTSTNHNQDSSESCTCGRQSAEVLRRRQEKKLEKLRRKQAKKEKLERKLARKLNPRKADHCKADVKMNCFSHDNSHWRTPPLWTEGPFCACTNSNNNTYWCVRNINSTHNYLYCEYVTGMVTYFDLKVDPHQLRNVLHTLSDEDINYMHHQVTSLREYSAAKTFLNGLSATQRQNTAAADSSTSGEYRGGVLPMDNLNMSPNIASVSAPITDDFASTAVNEAPGKSSRRKSLRRRSQRLEQRLLQLLAENSAISSQNGGGGGKKRANIKLLQRKIRQRKIERLKRRNGR